MKASNSFSENKVDGEVATGLSEQGKIRKKKEDKERRKREKKEGEKSKKRREGQGGRQAG